MTVFKTQGSQDDQNVEVTGTEFFSMLKLYRKKGYLTVSAIFAVVAGAMPILMNLTMGDMASVMASGTNFLDSMWNLTKQMIYIICAMVIIMSLTMGLRVRANPLFVVDLRHALFSSLMEQSIDYYDKASTGILISRLSEDVTLVRETYIDKALQVVQGLSQAIAGIILAFYTSWLVSTISLIVIPLVTLTYYLGEKYVDKLWYSYNETSSAAASKAEEVITQFRTVKAFDGEMKEAEHYCNGLTNVNSVYRVASSAHGWKDGIITFLSNSMTASILYFTSYLIVRKPEKGVEAGDTMILMMSLMFATLGITQALAFVDDFRKANVAAAKILQVMRAKPELNRKSGNSMDNIKGKIEFRNVGFKYSTRDEYAVKDLSFSVNPGETVALVGESGCGKTTTLSLLQRFYEISEGQILIDDVDIKTLSPVYLRSQIAIVPQSPVLFTMSISDNIRYSKESATDQDVAEAAQVGNAHNFIMAIKDNYKTEVQQTSLSGGQKQRICISRAILANSPILLLDEATAALDTESEQLVQQSLDTFRRGKTAIIVAHRLSTVKHANRILVFSQGKVVETGNHEELLEKGGYYADLVKFQLQ